MEFKDSIPKEILKCFLSEEVCQCKLPLCVLVLLLLEHTILGE